MQTKIEKRRKALAKLEAELIRGTMWNGLPHVESDIIRIKATIANLKKKL